MSAPGPTSNSHQPLLALLSRLRWRIRGYVIAEGVAVIVLWLVGMFWVGLALDYVPVLLGADEMPKLARQIWLAITVTGALAAFYYYIIQRVWRPLPDRSLALLIERQHPQLRDSLITTVERSEAASSSLAPASPALPSPAGDADEQGDLAALQAAGATVPGAEQAETLAETLAPNMLSETAEQAVRSVSDVRLNRIFSFAPLLWKSTAAVLAVASLATLWSMAGEMFVTGTDRLLWLSDQLWARRTHIELLEFDAGHRKIAKGADLTLRVRADATRGTPAPDTCTIIYQTNDGDRGRVNMSRDGEVTDGYQYYVFQGKPFRSVLDDIRFDVVGFDHRLRDCHLQVVLSPVVTKVGLQSQLPAYTGLEPRREDWAPGLQLPIGSEVQAAIETSKPIVSAKLRDLDSGEETTLSFEDSPQQSIPYHISQLTGRLAISISLTDTDGIDSTEPYVLTLGAVEDTPPTVDVDLRGIGTAITANARLPVTGQIRDDYQVADSWFQLQLAEQTSHTVPLNVAPGTDVDTALDLKQQTEQQTDGALKLKPQDRLTFSVRAKDHYDLDDQPHEGASDPVVLTVVRPDQLLAILDGRELGLRRRFEQLRSEMSQSRDSLVRLQTSFQPADEPSEEGQPSEGESTEEGNDGENGDASSVPNSAAANAERERQNLVELRSRWAIWAEQKAEQSRAEVGGIALAFEDIRDELINNRLDTEQRKQRLEQQIIAPLQHISEQLFPELKQQLNELQQSLANTNDAGSERQNTAGGDDAAKRQATEVVQQASEILLAIDAVLEKMLELEDYAELVNIVRALIEQQEELLKQTKDQQQQQLLDLLK